MLSSEALSALVLVFAVSITPGPNNIMLASSAASFGAVRTIPHIFGISLGVLTMFSAGALGMGAIYETFPQYSLVLQIVGSAYLFYLATRIWKIRSVGDEAVGRPITFIEALLFQFINPKAWLMVVNLSALYIASIGYQGLALILFFANLTCISVWAVASQLLKTTLLSSETRLLIFNRVMATLLVISIPAIFFG